MTFVQRLDLRQTTTLVMTPQLQQAIKLLQLSNLELTDFVAQELQQNPLLEEASAPESGSATPSSEDVPAPGNADDGDRVVSTDDQAAQIEQGAISEFPAAAEDGSGEAEGDYRSMRLDGSGGRTDFDDEFSDWAERASQGPTLREHLSAQLNTAIADPVQRLIGAALIEAVDSTGYLADGEATCAIIAEALGIAPADVERVLAITQQFTPAGVMARSLTECLAIQLRDRDRYDPAMAMLCRNLDLLAARRFTDLERICGVSPSDLADMVNEIRALDPKPGEQFGDVAAQAVLPDILMRAGSDGGWVIELNPDTLPRVLVNRRYYAEVRQACRTAKEREYLTERLTAANWLIRSLDQRANTILKVATEIVRQQEAFFVQGVFALRPLKLHNIAELIGMHESTVSRVTSNKYIATPRGLFELRYFFSAALPSSDGDASFAAKAIQHRIKSLIAAETRNNVLSDDVLVDKLQDEGIAIARRTVAKYREQMSIPSSVQRRREKNLEAPAAR